MRRVLTLAGPGAGRAYSDVVEEAAMANEVVNPSTDGPMVLRRGGFDVVLAAGDLGGSATPMQEWGAALCAFVEAGGGLVSGLAALSWFPGWEPWPRFLGARRVVHTAAGASVDLTGSSNEPIVFASKRHPVVAAMAPLLGFADPLPCFEPSADVEVLAERGGAPLVWAGLRDAGRIVVDSLAYDAASLAVPENRTILQRALRWVGES